MIWAFLQMLEETSQAKLEVEWVKTELFIKLCKSSIREIKYLRDIQCTVKHQLYMCGIVGKPQVKEEIKI